MFFNEIDMRNRILKAMDDAEAMNKLTYSPVNCYPWRRRGLFVFVCQRDISNLKKETVNSYFCSCKYNAVTRKVLRRESFQKAKYMKKILTEGVEVQSHRRLTPLGSY